MDVAVDKAGAMQAAMTQDLAIILPFRCCDLDAETGSSGLDSIVIFFKFGKSG